MLNRNKIQDRLLDWAAKNHREYAWRKPGISPYEILVAEMLLKRTTATAAARVYAKFLERYPNIQSLSKAKRKEIENMLKPIGYYRLRSKQILEIANFVNKKFNGKIPDNETDLLQIPYIGSYTAGAILCFGFSISAPMVDSNVERIMPRVFMSAFTKKPNNKKITELVTQLIPADNYKQFNLGLLDLGAMVCLPKNPRCSICPINKLCDYANSSQKRI